jgi:formylglycine-generating enzyme required for sulfatase activity
VFDAVGNVNEWVADWVPRTPGVCPGWGFSDDMMCFAGADPSSSPAALLRGGSFINGPHAGVFAIVGQTPPDVALSSIGFRCGR